MPSHPSDIPIDRTSSPASVASRRGRAALLLGLLGIPSFGLTAIAGLVLGLAGLQQRPRGWSVAATIVSFLVLASWLGGLVGALEMMQRQVPLHSHHWPAGHQLGFRLAEMASGIMDPKAPEPPSTQQLQRMMEQIPDSMKNFGFPTTPLVVEPLPAPAGVMLRCWIGVPRVPSNGSTIAEVDRNRGGIFMFGFDGREVWTFDRALDVERSAFDDPETHVLKSTVPAAKAIVQAARGAGGELPDAVEAIRLIEESGNSPHPSYRRRPGGIFDLVMPGTRDMVTYAAFGGVHVPILP